MLEQAKTTQNTMQQQALKTRNYHNNSMVKTQHKKKQPELNTPFDCRWGHDPNNHSNANTIFNPQNRKMSLLKCEK